MIWSYLIDGLIVGLIMVLLTALHEGSHILAAKLCNLRIHEVGFRMRPLPHPYVMVRWSNNRWHRRIFLYAGFASTFLLFLISWSFGFMGWSILMIAFGFQMLIETNPFYSDFTFFMVQERVENRYDPRAYSRAHKKFLFSRDWYIQFLLWTGMIIFVWKVYSVSF